MILSQDDQLFLKYARAIAILIIVFGHVGGFWFYEPYSSFLLTVVPVFFFISGSVAFFSYARSQKVSVYVLKRGIALLTPYYLACLLVLGMFFVRGMELPQGWINLLKWLTVTPTAEKVPFLFGHVWFLRVLLMITIVSPLLFEIHKRSRQYTQLLLFFVLLLPVSQCVMNTGRVLSAVDARLYHFLVMSIFFVFGFYYFTNKRVFTKKILGVLFILSILIVFSFIKIFQVEISLAKHEFYADFYYVAASFSMIFLLLLFSNVFLIFEKIYPLNIIFDFFHKHTFSVFLLHGFGLYVADNLFGMILPDMYQHHDIKYGLIMLFFTLIITCVVAVPFTAASSKVQFFISQRCSVIHSK